MPGQDSDDGAIRDDSLFGSHHNSITDEDTYAHM